MSDMEQRIPGYEPGSGNAAADAALVEISKEFGGTLTSDHKVLATSGATIQALGAMRRFMGHATLSEVEREIVAVGIARRTASDYYLAAAPRLLRRHGLGEGDVTAVLEGTPMSDPRHALIQEATQKLCDEQGRLTDAELAAYKEGGLGEAELIEIIAMVGWYLIATYTNNLARTDVDAFWLEDKG